MDEHTCANCLHMGAYRDRTYLCSEHDRETSPDDTCGAWTPCRDHYAETLELDTRRAENLSVDLLIGGSIVFQCNYFDASRHNFALSPAAARQLREWLQKTEEDAP